MARFYKTVDFSSEDFMSKLPIELMAKSLENVDNQVGTQENALNLLGSELAKINYLPQDKEVAETAIGGYNTQVEELTKAIQADPVNWRKSIGKVRDLTKTISTDYSKGQLGGLQGNYNKRIAAEKQYDEQLKGGHIQPEQKQLMLNTLDSKYKGLNWNSATNTGTTYQDEDIHRYIDIPKKAMDIASKIRFEEGSITKDNPQGLYMVQVGEKIERLRPEQIKGVLKSYLLADPESLGFLKQAKDIGYIADTDTFLENTLNAVVGTYAKNKIDRTYNISGNPVALHKDAQAHSDYRDDLGYSRKKADEAEKRQYDALTEKEKDKKKIQQTIDMKEYDKAIENEDFNKAKTLKDKMLGVLDSKWGITEDKGVFKLDANRSYEKDKNDIAELERRDKAGGLSIEEKSKLETLRGDILTLESKIKNELNLPDNFNLDLDFIKNQMGIDHRAVTSFKGGVPEGAVKSLSFGQFNPNPSGGKKISKDPNNINAINKNATALDMIEDRYQKQIKDTDYKVRGIDMDESSAEDLYNYINNNPQGVVVRDENGVVLAPGEYKLVETPQSKILIGAKTANNYMVTAVNNDSKSNLSERKLIVTMNNQILNSKFFSKIPDGEKELYDRNNILLSHAIKNLGIDDKTNIVLYDKKSNIPGQMEIMKDAEGFYSGYVKGHIIPELTGKTQQELLQILNKEYNIQDEYEVKTK